MTDANKKMRIGPKKSALGHIPLARGILRRQSGQALLEVAVLTPLLLLMLLGVVEMGRYAYISILVGNAARAGAAYGAQSLPQSVDTAGIQTAADNDFQNNGQVTSNPHPGDLVVWAHHRRKVSHVGIFYGYNRWGAPMAISALTSGVAIHHVHSIDVPFKAYLHVKFGR